MTIPFNMGHRRDVIVRVQGCRKGDGPTVEKVSGLKVNRTHIVCFHVDKVGPDEGQLRCA